MHRNFFIFLGSGDAPKPCPRIDTLYSGIAASARYMRDSVISHRTYTMFLNQVHGASRIYYCARSVCTSSQWVASSSQVPVDLMCCGHFSTDNLLFPFRYFIRVEGRCLRI